MAKFKQTAGGYGSNMAHIREYALSLPNREKKKVMEISDAKFKSRLALATKYYIYNFRKFTLGELKKKYSLNAVQGREFYNELTLILNEFKLNNFGVKQQVVGESLRITPSLEDRLNGLRLRHDSEIKRHGEQAKFKEGFVYLLENLAYPGWIKVGMTIDYEKRLIVYNMPNDPHRAYTFIKIDWATDRRIRETELLEKFKDKAVLTKGEWFKISKDLALALVDT